MVWQFLKILLRAELVSDLLSLAGEKQHQDNQGK